MFCMDSRRASRPWRRPRSGCQGKMGAMACATLTTGLAFILSVARGFLLLPPSSSPRHSISPAAFPAATSTSNLAANIRIQHPCLRNAFLGCAKSLRPVAASRWSKAPTLSPTCSPGGVTYGSAATSMRLRTGMLLMPGPGRKLAFVGLANAAAFATIGGGLLAGGLHAISGPDHLAALLPRIMGQRWRNSMRIGATWGLGHGFSATVIGLTAFFFKGRLGIGRNQRMVSMMGMWTEGLVGISLIAIGLLGLKESLLDHEETPSYETKSAGSAVVEGGGGLTVASKGSGKAIFLNGVLHGFSWDGAPSLAPALAFSSWASVLWFLLAYCSGTMVAMSATTTLIGEGSLRVGQALDQPDVPRKLSIVSSFVAIAIGVAWFVKAVLM